VLVVLAVMVAQVQLATVRLDLLAVHLDSVLCILSVVVMDNLLAALCGLVVEVMAAHQVCPLRITMGLVLVLLVVQTLVVLRVKKVGVVVQVGVVEEVEPLPI
jgi:hypothetical protein